MRFLHTADWHIGRMLYGKKRYQEFTNFLDWLELTIQQQSVDILLVPGDIFDTRTPSNRAQELYYNFLIKVSNTCCRHIVITSGNHDSPSFLDAPRAVLRALSVHVVGQVGEIEKELVELRDSNGETEALICAVPYLRDRDIRKAEAGESAEDKEQKTVDGIKAHYKEIADLAVERHSEILQHQPNSTIPIIAMGHLFAQGGKTGEGVRDLYVGNLGSIGADTFSPAFDYVALGHLHVPQMVDKAEHIRYSGSPIPMGFGEANQQKQVVLIDYTEGQINLINHPIPNFQPLVRMEGDLQTLEAELTQLIDQQSHAWVEIEYTGFDVCNDLRSRLQSIVESSSVEIRRIKNSRVLKSLQSHQGAAQESLEDLTEAVVFQRCLDSNEVAEEDRKDLFECYNEILKQYHEADTLAE